MKNRRQYPVHVIDFLFVLSLFCVFTVSAFLVVAIGARVYRSTADHMEDTYSTRTALSYVAEKIRRHDESGLVSLSSLEGHPALLLKDQEAGKTYITYLYADGERLLEFTAAEGSEVSADMGQEIIAVKDFSITGRENGFILLSAKASDGNPVSLFLHLRNSDGYTVVSQ